MLGRYTAVNKCNENGEKINFIYITYRIQLYQRICLYKMVLFDKMNTRRSM